MEFKKITPDKILENSFDLIGKTWMLVTTQKPDGSYNTMTASWGGTGVLWGKNVVFVFIRPQRYTYELMENCQNFSLSFLEESFRKKLGFCGKVSGRDKDKIKECGFNLHIENETAFIEEGFLSLTCKKLYFGDIQQSGFIDEELLKNYTQKDYHRMYVAEITGVYKK